MLIKYGLQKEQLLDKYKLLDKQQGRQTLYHLEPTQKLNRHNLIRQAKNAGQSLDIHPGDESDVLVSYPKELQLVAASMGFMQNDRLPFGTHLQLCSKATEAKSTVTAVLRLCSLLNGVAEQPDRGVSLKHDLRNKLVYRWQGNRCVLHGHVSNCSLMADADYSCIAALILTHSDDGASVEPAGELPWKLWMATETALTRHTVGGTIVL